MAKESHDHNFKNVFMDFPNEALEWILPQTIQSWGPVQEIEFVRQEPKKQKLSDAHFALDMPILFTFAKHRLLLWLVEFQEDKTKFSIHKLAHYTIDYMAAYPNAQVVPTVLFTDRKKWRKDITRELESKLKNQLFLYFKYVFIKLFDFNAIDYYNVNNPVVKILLPKMNYALEDRYEVIRQAYHGLYILASHALFDKYVDFIDVYAEVSEKERETLYHEMIEHKETAMLAQYIQDKGKEKWMQEGIRQGVQETLKDSILKMYRKGMPTDKIADILEIDKEKVLIFIKEGKAV